MAARPIPKMGDTHCGQPKEAAMTENAERHNRPTDDELHPRVYEAMIGLTIWLLLSIWFLFDRGAYLGLILAMITVLFLIISGIPTLIWLTWRRNAKTAENRDLESYRAWASHEFATQTGELTGAQAATQILLPLAAVSIGMTIFGLVFYFAVPSLS
jgi:hypothetical protein